MPALIYEGAERDVIRVWGRRRIHVLERLVPVARKFTVHLLGSRLPSFYIADLGHMSFTLGLSGWTANDWSQAGNFDLMAPRADVDDVTKRRVFAALKESWLETPDRLAARLGLSRAIVLGALGAYTQAGRAVFDLNKSVYRARELSRDPLPLEQLRFANPREESATRFLLQRDAVRINAKDTDTARVMTLRGEVKDKDKTFHPSLTVDRDQLRRVHSSYVAFIQASSFPENSMSKRESPSTVAFSSARFSRATISLWLLDRAACLAVHPFLAGRKTSAP